MLVKVSETLIDINEKKFLNFEDMPKMNGKKNKYFSKSKSDISGEARKVRNKLYIETNMSSNGIRNLIVKILKEYGYGIKDFKVYFLADYTGISK